MKKVLSTIGLAVVLASSTFVNAGIIVAGKGGSPSTGCNATSRDGIIVAGRDGIIVAGRDIIGIIVAGITGVIVTGGTPSDCTSAKDGILVSD